MTIATRAAAAKPEETAGLLQELIGELNPLRGEPSPVTLDDMTKWKTWIGSSGRCAQRFIGAGAYMDAAMMLVPDGWLIVHLSELGAAGGCVCKLGNPGTSEEAIADAGERTMALALIAAIAQSKGV